MTVVPQQLLQGLGEQYSWHLFPCSFCQCWCTWEPLIHHCKLMICLIGHIKMLFYVKCFVNQILRAGFRFCSSSHSSSAILFNRQYFPCVLIHEFHMGRRKISFSVIEIAVWTSLAICCRFFLWYCEEQSDQAFLCLPPTVACELPSTFNAAESFLLEFSRRCIWLVTFLLALPPA